MDSLADAPSSAQSKALQAAHDRIRRKKERQAAEALAKAQAEGSNPSSSSHPSMTPSATLDSLTFSTSSSTSGFQYAQSSSPAFQLSLPGPLTPLQSIYQGPGIETPPLPPSSTLGLSTSISQAGSGFGSAVLQTPSDAGRNSAKMTASERRRAKEAAGEAIGLEDEIEWGYEEETMGEEAFIPEYTPAPPLPPKSRHEEVMSKEKERQEALARKAERLRMEELSKKLSGARASESEGKGGGSENGSMHSGIGGGEAKKPSRWNPHAHGVRSKDTGGVGFQVLVPDGGYKEIGIDAQYRKEKKKEDRKEMVGRLFGRKGKVRDEGKKREAWEDELEGLSRAESKSESKERSINPSPSLPSSSKISLPSSSSQPVRSILKQPGQPSRRVQTSFTAPSLSSLSEDPRPSPSTQTTALSSISGLPSSSYNLHTPHGETCPLPTPPPTGTGKKGGRPETADTITAASYGSNQDWHALTRPFGSMPDEPNMDRRPSLASSLAVSVREPSRNDTQSSLDSSSGLFYSAPLQTLGPALGLDPGPETRKKVGIFAALSNLGQGSERQTSTPTAKPRVFPLPPKADVQTPYTIRTPPTPLSSAHPPTHARNQDSRYPDLTPPRTNALDPLNSAPSVSLLDLPQGFNASRRPSDTTVAYGPITPRANPEIRANRRRSASETLHASPISNDIAPPSSLYVNHRRATSRDSDPARSGGYDVGRSERLSSVASTTRQSPGVLAPAIQSEHKLSGIVTSPNGISRPTPSSSAATHLPPPSRVRQQHTNAISTPPDKSTPDFAARDASAFNITFPSFNQQETVVEHFESKDSIWPSVAFRMENMGPERYMETYFPPSELAFRGSLCAIMPEAPMNLGRIEAVRILQATVVVRVHPKPEEGDDVGKSASARLGVAGNLAPSLKSMGDAGPRLGGDGSSLVSTEENPSQWKKMTLVLSSFSFGRSDGATGALKLKATTPNREAVSGLERSVAHLHLFDPSPSPPSKRPKTNETFGPGGAKGFGGNGHQLESEKMEYGRRALRAGCMVVLGDVVDLGCKPDEILIEGESKADQMERRTRRDVVWFGSGEGEGWFVQFKDQSETDLWLKETRSILRRMGREELSTTIHTPYALLREFDERQAQLAAQEEAMKERFLSPEEHIKHHLTLGHSIWDPRTNPPPRTPKGDIATRAEYDMSPAGRWARYEHPAIRILREKDKLETFDQLACGRVGWREWLWPVPPGKELRGSGKSQKRAAGKKRRRKKMSVRRALSGKGKKGETETPRATMMPRLDSAPRPESPTLPSDIINPGPLAEITPKTSPNPGYTPSRAIGSDARSASTSPADTHSSSPASPLRPLLLSAEPSKSIVLPRQTSSLSIGSVAPSVFSTHSNTSGHSANSGGSANTVRSTATFGRSSAKPSPPTGYRPPSAGSTGSVRLVGRRPGTGNRNIPPPSLPPPTTPLPPPPTGVSSIAAGRTSLPLKASQSSLSSFSSAEHEGTPKKLPLALFPTPPTTTPPSVGSHRNGNSRSRATATGTPSSVFGSNEIITPTRRGPSSSAAPSAYPAQLAAVQPPAGGAQRQTANSKFVFASSLPHRQAPPPPPPPPPIPMTGDQWYAASLASGASSVSLVSDASGLESMSGSMVSGGTGASSRRRRMMASAVDLAGEINAIDAARAAEIRAAAAAAAALEEEAIDENRPRVIRFA